MLRHDSLHFGSRAVSSALFAAGLILASPGFADGRYDDDDRGCDGNRSISLVNGRIHTMDKRERVVSSVIIEDGKFARVGGRDDGDRCAKEIDLRGRTVVPGIIDNHNHIILLGLRPGHDVRLDLARTVGQALELLAEKAKTLKQGEWVVSLGGISANQFLAPTGNVRRFPNYAELNAALPKNPVFLFESFSGPSRTNAAGKGFFESKGISVNADGTLDGGFSLPPDSNPSLQALHALRELPEHNNLPAQIEGLRSALAFGASVGITTHVDQGSFHFAESYYGNTGAVADGLAAFDQYRAFDSVRALHARGEMPARVQLNYLHQDTLGETPQLEARLNNTTPFLGDEWLSNGGIGEFTGGDPFRFLNSEPWLNGTRLVAINGWRNENHSLNSADFKTILDLWAKVNEELKAGIVQTPANPVHPPVMNPDGITKLRWVIAHVPFIDEPYIDLAKELGVGLSVLGGWRWLSGSFNQNGPPFRTILARGARAGMSSDGMQISVMDPWIGMYYAVTGKNAAGTPINTNETITRRQVLRLYTADNAWFLGPEWEQHLGTIEEGKWADLVVLSDDYFRVPEEEIPNIHSLLTIVNGKIVHDELTRKKKRSRHHGRDDD